MFSVLALSGNAHISGLRNPLCRSPFGPGRWLFWDRFVLVLGGYGHFRIIDCWAWPNS